MADRARTSAGWAGVGGIWAVAVAWFAAGAAWALVALYLAGSL